MIKNIILVGNGVASDILYEYVKNDKRYDLIGFSVFKEYIENKSKYNLPVYALEHLKQELTDTNYSCIMAIGYKQNCTIRANINHYLKTEGYKIERYIHPGAQIHSLNLIGNGCIILPGAVVEPYASLSDNCVVWSNCVIGHHVEVGANCWIAAGTVIGGASKVGNNCFLGLNVTISNGIKVGSNNIIGANVALHKNTKENEVYLSSHGVKHRFNSFDYDKYFFK